MDPTLTVLFIVAIVGTAVVGGVFFAFSNFIMSALGQLEAREAVVAMQRINVTVLNRWFFALFFGSGLAAVLVAGWAVFAMSELDPTWATLGAAMYLFGCIGVTGVVNVPLNERLAQVDANGPESEAVWSGYLRRWTRANHVRTVASGGAAVLLIVAS